MAHARYSMPFVPQLWQPLDRNCLSVARVVMVSGPANAACSISIRGHSFLNGGLRCFVRLDNSEIRCHLKQVRFRMASRNTWLVVDECGAGASHHPD